MTHSLRGRSAAWVVAACLLTATRLSAQTLEIENLDGVPYPDRLVFSRIGSLSAPPPNGVHERAVLRIRNTGAGLLSLTKLATTGPDGARFILEDSPGLPVSIDPGSFLDLTFRFIAESSSRVHNATLSISSNDPAKPVVTVSLSGYWQRASKTILEPTLQQVVDLFGYGTEIVGIEQTLNQAGKIVASGDEVISAYWTRPDAAAPVTVRQLAAFHTYPENHAIHWHYRGSTSTTLIVRHNGEDSQSVLPRKIKSVDPAQASFVPNGVFGFRVQTNEWSDPTLNRRWNDDCSGGNDTCGHHVRFWPVKDRQGAIVANTFIMAMDFSGVDVNFDYQDNVYLISNIAPAFPVAGLEEIRINAGGPMLTTGGIQYLANMYSIGGESSTPDCQVGDVAGTTDDELYRTAMSEATTFSYRIPAIAGSYLVRLHFAETTYGSCSDSPGEIGRRVFDVFIEGESALLDFDISAEAGALTALVKSSQVEMKDGFLDIDFAAGVDFPTVAAIEVIGSANIPPVASFIASPLTGNAPPLEVSFSAAPSYDPDGSIATYAWSFGDGATATGPLVNHTYTASGRHTVRLQVTDDAFASTSTYRSITIEPGAANAFAEAGGLVVFEAEHFHDNIPRDVHSWTMADLSASVDKAMRCEPVFGKTINAGYVTKSPEMQYRVHFETTGTYYIWARALAPDNSMDSWHYGIDGQAAANADRLSTGSPFGTWRWINTTLDGPSASIPITSPGEHVISVFMREDGLYLDRILLTTDSGFTPFGNGPPESTRAGVAGNEPPTATFTASAESGKAPLTVTFNAGASTDIDGSIISYAWDFQGDTVVDTTLSTPEISFVYGLKGSYSATLTVTDSGGASAQVSRTIEVAPVDFTEILWSTVKETPLKRGEGFGGFASDNRLYLFGGYYGDPEATPTDRVDAYDPITDTWQRRSNLPVGLSHPGFVIDGEDVYIAGGYPRQADGTGQEFSTKAVWKYNTRTDTYTALPDLPAARSLGALVLVGRTLHFFGGSSASRTDVGHHWTLSLDGGTSWVSAPSLPFPRNHLGGAVIDGKIYAVGGETGQDAGAVCVRNVHRYDPTSSTWTEVAGLPEPTAHINAATFVMDGRIIVAGGDNAFRQWTNAVYAYSPLTNAWETLTPLPAIRMAGVADDFDGKLYFTTGSLTVTTYKGTPVNEISNAAPTARFTTSPKSGMAPLSVTFDGSGSFDPDGSIEAYEWNFGDSDHHVDDGSASTTGRTITHTYDEPGTFTITLVVTDNGGATGTTKDTVIVSGPDLPHFVESGGLVVVEVENYSEKIDRGAHQWIREIPAGCVGSAMQATPDSGANIDSDFAPNSPEMQYPVQFTTTGTYYVWARALAPEGDGDSWHVGLDGRPVESADRMTVGNGFLRWKWINKTMDGVGSSITIAAPGAYILNVWMREDGVYLDRLLLTTDAGMVPGGDGPAESPRAGSDPAKAGAEYVQSTTGVEPVPEHYELSGNFPNPFNPVTTIRYAIPDEAHVRLEVYDFLGRRVALLHDGVQRPGFHQVQFNSEQLASGVYICRLQAGAYSGSSQMVVLK